MSENETDKESPENVHKIEEDEGRLEDFSAHSEEETSSENEAPQVQEPTLEEQLEKAKSDFLYLQAEFDNYKKRTLKERSELLKYGGERIFVDLLDVVDNFDRALSHEVTSENIQQFSEGVKLIHTSLVETLKKLNVSELECLGQPFDPNRHEALGAEPTDKFEPGHITQVIRKPYTLHDKVIRPAQVVVAKEVEETNEEST